MLNLNGFMPLVTKDICSFKSSNPFRRLSLELESGGTQGDLTQNFPIFPYPVIVNLDFHIKTDPGLSWVSNNRLNDIEIRDCLFLSLSSLLFV